ncbi:MAG: acetolactate synthase small subunit [Candidatus Nanopelagicaceae bacterium]|jgi:acetolactate synthase-1/3 small subunit
MAKHTLAVLVDNSSGVLARVASLFARRAFNIDSLAVGPTEDPTISRMTIVVNVEGHALEQVIRQLDKLINVIHVSEIKPAKSTQEELILVKVKENPRIESILAKYGAVVVDNSEGAVIVKATNPVALNEELLDSLKQFGIIEFVQSGVVALAHGAESLAEQTLDIQSISTDRPVDYQN